MTSFIVSTDEAGARLDSWLASKQPDLSRSRIQQYIRSGHVQVDQAPAKPHQIIKAGMEISLHLPPAMPTELQPEPIPLHILYEDTDILVLNKPAGLVVHPAAHHETGTLVHALLHHCTDLAGIGGELRPGIVHRLDKDTSGVMVIAKTEPALMDLAKQFKQRTVKKSYRTLVKGVVTPPTGTIESLIGRHPNDRKKMSARVTRGRAARTTYEMLESFLEASFLSVAIETGRTHQIRVHMAHHGHPVLGDSTYGRTRTLSDGTVVPRQMLHATNLAFQHPSTRHPLEFEAPIPEDMRLLIGHLRSLG